MNGEEILQFRKYRDELRKFIEKHEIELYELMEEYNRIVDYLLEIV